MTADSINSCMMSTHPSLQKLTVHIIIASDINFGTDSKKLLNIVFQSRANILAHFIVPSLVT